MLNWFQEQAWWIALAITILIALFPTTFAKVGTNVKKVIVNYWLQIGISINIILLSVLCVFLILP